MNTIAFPGLGIGEFTLNPVAFSVFGLEIRWYGIFITTGIIFAFLYANWRATKREGFRTDDMLDYAIYIVLSGVIGARLYYVIMEHENYHSLLDVINTRNGGLAIYGGIIGGVIAALVVSRVKHKNPLRVLDAAAPGVMIGQLLGRWGNFFNGEAFGYETEIFCRMGLQKESWSRMYYYHPTFLYESLWNLAGFLIINALYKKKKFNGEIFLMYVSWYGFGRMFIEGLRTDSLYIFDTIRVSQLLAAICFIAGTVIIAVKLISMKKHPGGGEPVFIAPACASAEQSGIAAEKAEASGESPDEPANEKAPCAGEDAAGDRGKEE